MDCSNHQRFLLYKEGVRAGVSKRETEHQARPIFQPGSKAVRFLTCPIMEQLDEAVQASIWERTIRDGHTSATSDRRRMMVVEETKDSAEVDTRTPGIAVFLPLCL
jgi:hypothetical protein